MGKENKLKRERRALGLCLECGCELDTKKRFVKCEVCREKWGEKIKEYRSQHATLKSPNEPTPNEIWARKKMKMEAEKAIAAEKLKKQIEKCTYCEWGSIVGTIVYCPFMNGICLKRGNEENEIKRVSGACQTHTES